MRIESIVFALCVVCASLPAMAADMATRDVVALLFAATPEKPANLSGKDLRNLDLAGVDFKRANLKGAFLFGADLSGAKLSGCDLEGANLDRATLTRADFSGANLANASIRRPTIYTSMTPDAAEAPTFRGSNLTQAWLEGLFDYSDFREADLSNARFGALNPRDNQGIISGAVLRSAKFTNATLKDVIFVRADLSFADFSGARLDGGDLRDANLLRAIFHNASLLNADLSGAQTEEANW